MSGVHRIVDAFGLVGSVIAERFRVIDVVAAGGFGLVYAGLHLGLNAKVAIKVLHMPAELGRDARARFVSDFASEARTSAKLKHPHIVQVLDVGDVATALGCAPYLVFEWLEGETLAASLQRRNGGPGQAPSTVLALLRPVFEALAFAHDEGIAHRDVKPANIMLVSHKRGTTVKLLDFGIAKTMMEGETAGSGPTRSLAMGASFSPRYAAPEQVGGSRSGPWTDVHALGLLMVQVLTDRFPYQSRDLPNLLCEIVGSKRPTPASFGFDVGPLEPVLARALACRPEQRYADAGEMLAAVVQAIESVPQPPRVAEQTVIGLRSEGRPALTSVAPAHDRSAVRRSSTPIPALAVTFALICGTTALIARLHDRAPVRTLKEVAHATRAVEVLATPPIVASVPVPAVALLGQPPASAPESRGTEPMAPSTTHLPSVDAAPVPHSHPRVRVRQVPDAAESVAPPPPPALPVIEPE